MMHGSKMLRNDRKNVLSKALTFGYRHILTGALFVLLSVSTAPLLVHAATNQAAALTPDMATAAFKACAATAPLGLTCKVASDGFTTECNSTIAGIISGGTACTFTYPDKSKVVVNPNLVAGSQSKNLDSDGTVVGTNDTGFLSMFKDAGTGTQTGNRVDGSQTLPGAAGQVLKSAAADMISGISLFILTLAGWMVGVAGTLFNWSVVATVFQFGHLIGNSAGMLAAWTVLRDIGNIFLLFGFIFMGIGTILNLHDYSAKKALPALVIFAVLLNFSLLAAEAVIDTSNVFASLMYSQSGICSTEAGADCDQNDGIAGQIMQTAGVSGIFGGSVIKEFGDDDMKNAVITLGLALFVTITAIVLLAGSIMFITRAVVLSFLIVLSPIGFAGMAIPPLHKLANLWWHKLISNAFFAPIYLLMIFVSLKLMQGVAETLPGGTSNRLIDLFKSSGQVSNVSVALIFTLLIGFMMAALMVAKKIGVEGAGFATKTAGGLVLGGMGFAGRRTVGMVAYKANEELRKRGAERTGMGRLLVGGIDKFGAKASFDPRGNKAFGAAMKGAGLNVGEAQHGGMDHIVHEKSKALEAMGKKQKRTKAEEEVLEGIKKDRDNAKVGLAQLEQQAEKRKVDISNQQVKTTATEAIHKAQEGKVKAAEDAVSAQEKKLQAAEAGGMLAESGKARAELKSLQDVRDTEKQELATLDTARQTEARGLQDLTSAQQGATEAAAAFKKVIEDSEVNIKKAENAPVTRFAENLEKDARNPLTRFTTYTGPINDHAAHELREWAGKSKTQRQLEKMTEVLEKGNKQEHKDAKHLIEEVAHDAPAAHAADTHATGDHAHG